MISKARFHAGVAFSQLDNSKDGVVHDVPVVSRHRRFASVADFNTRVKNSFKRTLNRAWGSTHVTVSLSLDVEEIGCMASSSLLEEAKGYLKGMSRLSFVPRLCRLMCC